MDFERTSRGEKNYSWGKHMVGDGLGMRIDDVTLVGKYGR